MSELFACPCCGQLTLTAPSPGSWLTCPVCEWTDKDTSEPAALEELIEAQRAGGWPAPEASPRERERDALLARIEKAFADVSPAGRTPLRRSFHADYDGEPDIDWGDDDRRWQDIPAYVLDFLGRGTTAFTFGNPQGFRYYMPAFMRHSLRDRHASPAVSALDVRPGSDSADPSIFSDEQRAVVRDFLRHVVTYDAPAPWAERALERIWT